MRYDKPPVYPQQTKEGSDYCISNKLVQTEAAATAMRVIAVLLHTCSHVSNAYVAKRQHHRMP